MDLLYIVRKKTTNSFICPASTYNRSGLCSISNCNIVAFTTKTEINDSTNKSLGFYVYVADINTPWFCFKVTSNKHHVTVLEWDVLGKYLLIGDMSGSVQIWVQKENLLSDWMQLYITHFSGEEIIKAVFFHNGSKIWLTTDKRDVFQYMEKFQRVKTTPSVRQFGGVSAEGVLVITATGMLGAFLIPTELSNINLNGSSATSLQQHTNAYTLPSVTKSLSHTRFYITTADICYGRNGHFMIAVSNGNDKNTMIQCYRVLIHKQNDKLMITSQSLRSFFASEGAARDINDLKVTNLKWLCTEESVDILIGSECATGSFLERWSLTEKSTPLHKLFQTSTKNEVFKTQVWVHKDNYRNNSKIIGICPSKFHYGSTAYVFVTMSDNTIYCLLRDSLQNVMPNSTPLTSVCRIENEHSSKQILLEAQISSNDISPMSRLMLAVDTQGQLYSFKITYPYQDQISIQQSISLTTSLLEYCLISGYDALDIFLTLKLMHLDGIVDRLTENFTRQPPYVQQYYYVNFLTMKTNLYRLSISGQTKAYDLTSLLMLHSILIAFKSLLRPSDLISHDKGPAENLAMVLSESVPDIDKVLLGLEPKDFTVEQSTLKSLQQLIQWVADLALNILAKLPENRASNTTSRNTGYDISRDIVALNSIRELLVMMRIWGLLSPECLPVFSRSADNLDILATLFRQLTRLALNPNEPDDILLDECCLLPSQVFIPQLQFIPSQSVITSPLLPHLLTPINLEYFIEPNNLRYQPDIPSVEGGLSSNNIVDSLRHLQLGKSPLSLRRCTRCGACSSVWSVAKTAAMRAWEQRWASGCKCGGFWILQIAETIN